MDQHQDAGLSGHLGPCLGPHKIQHDTPGPALWSQGGKHRPDDPREPQLHAGHRGKPHHMSGPVDHELEPGKLRIAGDIMGVAMMLKVKRPHERWRHGL